MSNTGLIPWNRLERLSARLFLLGAVILAANAVIVLYDVVEGTVLRLPLGQVFVGTGWTAVLIGMLGLYPRLAEHRKWLARACAFFAVVGVIGYAVMTVVYAAAVGGLSESTVESLTPVFLPPVLVGSLIAFPLFAVTTLLTGAYSRPAGLLLAAPTLIFVANVLTGGTATSIFAVLIALVVVFGTIGYSLRADSASAERTKSAAQTSV